MRIMQTLGRHGGKQEGIFQYKRTSDGVTIDTSISSTTSTSHTYYFTHAEWAQILGAIDTSPKSTFTLTGAGGTQSLYATVAGAVLSPSGGFGWNDSLKSYVCAILEHEGSIDLYHGLVGKGKTPVSISLVRG